MGTVIDRVDITGAGWRGRHSALHVAVSAAKTCLQHAGRHPDDVDLLVNAGLYRDRNLGEPALAALIQDDIGANPEDPHAGAHGTFSFDVANGTCGLLTALHIVDGFLRSHAIRCALVVASDADPGGGMSERFPFSPVGAALVCSWMEGDYGLDGAYWANVPDDGESFSATVGLEDRRNVLRFRESASMDAEFAAAGALAAHGCLDGSSLGLSDVDVIVAAPARRRYRAALANRLGVPVERIVVADDERMHTASLAAALDRGAAQLPVGARVLLVAASAGITAGAALYRQPPPPTSRG
jgi:3-oxoacyl-[acyl-carrier-protein] synthase III